MKPQFDDLDSSLDDTAADYIAEAMMMIVQEAGYLEIENGRVDCQSGGGYTPELFFSLK